MAPASHVQRARLLLEIAAGKSYMDACRITGRRSIDKVGELVSRFNQEGLAAIRLRHGGGPPVVTIGPEQRALIVSEDHRQPTIEQDDTATWSVTLLRRALIQKGLKVSRDTVWTVLFEAGRHKRKRGVALVIVPDTEAKNGIVRSRVSGR